ncbi:fatty acyl-CoA reductase wat-like [Plodia interpunctella]|uniref:fatty acyl-CoA reductase wat-like n=1 Tax=Plodia interpunctella TaxID=58824 RepID=UPI0023684293|nr:fatty acyl-CoA reductase wat-like [Plodia interpunctella]
MQETITDMRLVPSALDVVLAAERRLVPIHEATLKGDSEVQKFYAGSVVLVTGGSGFLGKQLIEKLFRTCDVKKLYILLRAKKGKSIGERLDYILRNPVYDTLRETRPWFADRIEAVEGDIASYRLGVADHMWDRLVDEVTVVFHGAATINFADPLQLATNINVKGTLEMLEFGKACKNLRSYVHISTAYNQALKNNVSCDILEEFPKAPLSPTTLVDLANRTETKVLDEMFHKYLAPEYPNTYAYTKAVAEEAVRTMAGDLPICVVRPSIVIPAYTEPSAGWVDKNSIYGASGIIMGLGLGVIHTLISDPDIKIDIIPVDIVNNAVIVAGWETARRREQGETDTKIYTVGSSNRNHITWRFLTNVFDNEGRKHLSSQAVWYAFAVQTKSKHLYLALAWLLHFIPGYIVDGVLMIRGKKPQVSKIYRLLNTMATIFSFFTLRGWNFKDDNLLQLYKSLSKTDQQIFNMDIATLDMKEVIYLWHIGLRRFYLKDKLNDQEKSMKKQFFLRIITYTFIPIYLYFLFKISCFVFYGLYYLIFSYLI